MAAPRVTVIPFSNDRLQSVDTPYVAFEHPFKDRAGRFERQADLLDLYGDRCFWTIGDVWPAAAGTPLTIQGMKSAVIGVQEQYYTKKFLWPEGVLYRTSVAKLYPIDERVTYRPHLAYWTGIYEDMPHTFPDDCAYSTEAHIEVPSRVLYPHKPACPQVLFSPVTLPLTVIMAVGNNETTIERSLKSLLNQTFQDWEIRIVDCGSTDGTMAILASVMDPRVLLVPGHRRRNRSQGLNLAMTSARGERLVIWEPTCVSMPQRLERQLAFPGDIVGCQLAEIAEHGTGIEHQPRPGDLLFHAYTRYSVNEPIPAPTLMFHRRLVEAHGGFDNSLPVRHGYEFELRMLEDQRNSYGRLEHEMVLRIAGATADEALLHGQYYAALVGRDIAVRHESRRGCHEWVITK